MKTEMVVKDAKCSIRCCTLIGNGHSRSDWSREWMNSTINDATLPINITQPSIDFPTRGPTCIHFLVVSKSLGRGSIPESLGGAKPDEYKGIGEANDEPKPRIFRQRVNERERGIESSIIPLARRVFPEFPRSRKLSVIVQPSIPCASEPL